MQSIIARLAVCFTVLAAYLMGVLMDAYYAEGMEFQSGLCVAALVLFIGLTWDITRE